GLSQCRRVVDAVPNHGHPSAGRLKLRHLLRLVARKDLSDYRVDPEEACNPAGRGLVVPTQHDDLDPEGLEGPDGRLRRGTRGVGDADPPDCPAIHRGDDCGAPAGGEGTPPRLEPTERDAVAVHQATIADHDRPALDRGAGTVTREVLETLRP